MKLSDIFAASPPHFSFEFFPPKTDKGEESLLEHAAILKTLNPAFFSITYGAGGTTRDKTVSLGRRIKDLTGVEVVCHVTCVGQSKDEVRAVIREIKSLGLENVLALRGDPPRGEPDWTPHPEGFHYAIELVRELRARGDFSIGVAGFPEVHPQAPSREADLAFLKQKVEAGADAVITQLFFDNEYFYRFDRDLKAMGVTAAIVPGIMPLLSAAQIRRITTLSSARIPDPLDRDLTAAAGNAEAERELGIAYAAEQIRELLNFGVPGVHIYCLNRSEAPLEIFRRLGLPGAGSTARS